MQCIPLPQVEPSWHAPCRALEDSCIPSRQSSLAQPVPSTRRTLAGNAGAIAYPAHATSPAIQLAPVSSLQCPSPRVGSARYSTHRGERPGAAGSRRSGARAVTGVAQLRPTAEPWRGSRVAQACAATFRSESLGKRSAPGDAQGEAVRCVRGGPAPGRAQAGPLSGLGRPGRWTACPASPEGTEREGASLQGRPGFRAREKAPPCGSRPSTTSTIKAAWWRSGLAPADSVASTPR